MRRKKVCCWGFKVGKELQRLNPLVLCQWQRQAAKSKRQATLCLLEMEDRMEGMPFPLGCPLQGGVGMRSRQHLHQSRLRVAWVGLEPTPLVPNLWGPPQVEARASLEVPGLKGERNSSGRPLPVANPWFPVPKCHQSEVNSEPLGEQFKEPNQQSMVCRFNRIILSPTAKRERERERDFLWPGGCWTPKYANDLVVGFQKKLRIGARGFFFQKNNFCGEIFKEKNFTGLC